MNNLTFLIAFLFANCPQTTLMGGSALSESDTLLVEKIPIRPKDGISGSEFAQRTITMSGAERQRAALSELRSGNIPEFLRRLKPVRLSHKDQMGKCITATIWVTPDYLAIGSDDDFLRIPLTYPSAIIIAEEFGFILPTRKMVDAIYEQSTCRLKPQPLFPSFKMRSSEYYLKHQQKIEEQRLRAGCMLGDLISGHKKDVVLTNRLLSERDKIAIYGWHNQKDEPIQPLSTFHGTRYTDYSHGIRLVYQTVLINGEPRSIFEVLEDPLLAPALTYEGVIAKLRSLLRWKK